MTSGKVLPVGEVWTAKDVEEAALEFKVPNFMVTKAYMPQFQEWLKKKSTKKKITK